MSIRAVHGGSCFQPLSEGLTYFKFKGWWYFRSSSNVNRTLCSANSGDPEQMQHCASSHLGLCCLPISSHIKDIRL